MQSKTEISRTLVSILNRPHAWLIKNSRVYSKWHQVPFAAAFHWAALGAYVVAVLALSLNITQNPLPVASAESTAFDFESYSLGNINGQDGWSQTGTGSHGYDVAVVNNTFGYGAFGAKSLRASNAITSGAFGDHAFTRNLIDPAAESAAYMPVLTGGVRQSSFVAQWDVASTIPGAEQPGLAIRVSPYPGDSSANRMSWVEMLDTPGGLNINFEDYHDDVPYGSLATPSDGCSGTDNFIITNLSTGLDRSIPHTIRMEMSIVDGARNDVVRMYVDGTLKYTGTSWEDYFRWCEGPPSFPVNQSRSSRSLLFRASGTAVPANAGKGFLFDNVIVSSGNPVKAITSFKILGNGTVNESDHTIAITVPNGTDPTSLTPTITIAGSSVSPASGVAQNFSTPQTYTVKSADGSSQAYVATVTVSPPAVTTLHIIKHIINDNGGTSNAANFNLHVLSSGSDVAGSPAVGAESPGTTYNLVAGAYTVSEDAHDGYSVSFGGDCDSAGGITFGAGVDKTCTLTNTANPPIVAPVAVKVKPKPKATTVSPTVTTTVEPTPEPVVQEQNEIPNDQTVGITAPVTPLDANAIPKFSFLFFIILFLIIACLYQIYHTIKQDLLHRKRKNREQVRRHESVKPKLNHKKK